MSDIKKNYDISTESKLFCLNMTCVNNVQHSCNLKGVSISENGTCAGIVKIKIKKENK